MLSLYSVLSVALWWTAVTSTPTPIGTSDNAAAGQTFTLEQVPVERTLPWGPPHAMKRDYLKYGLTPPEEIEQAIKLFDAGGPGTGTVAAKGYKSDTEYLINVQVGKHNLSLDLDTGSSDLWVMSNLQQPSQLGNRPTNRVYDAKSTTAQAVAGHSWLIRYGDQSNAKGRVFWDQVSVGSLTVPKQAVEAAETVSGTFARDPYNDGLLGLGFSRLNTIKPEKQKTWFDNIRPKLAAPLFTASLKRRSVGSYDFGYLDKAKYKGEIVYTNVKSQRGFWDFQITGFAIGNNPVRQLSAPAVAVADTGSSLWYARPEMVAAYYKDVGGASNNPVQGGYMFPCDAKLPDISVIVEGKKVTVPGINMNYQNAGGNKCFGGLQSAPAGMTQSGPGMIFGDVFLKNLFVVHEAPIGGQPRLGFASAA